MNTKTLMKGGHWREKGYLYNLYFVLPEIKKASCVNLTGKQQKSIKIAFPTIFNLTSDNLYINIVLSIFGFGMGLEVHSRT